MNVCLAHGGDVSQPSGGTDRVTALAAGMAERGFEVTLVVPEPADQLPGRLGGVEIVPVTTGLFGVNNAIVRAGQISAVAKSKARNRGATLQLEHSSLAGVGTLRGCRGYVLDMHDLAFPRFDHVDASATPALKRGVAWLERRAVDRARHIVVVSPYLEEFLSEEWDVPEELISVIPNGYFPDRLEGIDRPEPVSGRVCFLGTLHPKVDIEAFGAIADLAAVSEVVVIGDGARRDAVERLAEEHAGVRATGRLPDQTAFEYLASAEVAINPQTSSDLQRSSSPVKLFYYAALGKPMVVTNGPSVVRKLVAAGAAISSTNTEEFVQAVETLIKTPSLREELSMNGLALSEEFTWEVRCDGLAELHEHLST